MRDPEHTAIKASDVTIGSVFHVLPESIKESQHVLEDKAKAAVLLMRLEPDDIKVAKARDWGYEGIVAYSKICTWAAPSASTSSRPTTCCARVTSRPST